MHGLWQISRYKTNPSKNLFQVCLWENFNNNKEGLWLLKWREVDQKSLFRYSGAYTLLRVISETRKCCIRTRSKCNARNYFLLLQRWHADVLDSSLTKNIHYRINTCVNPKRSQKQCYGSQGKNTEVVAYDS